MNNNMTKAHRRLLRENYENACNAYLLALANMWDWNCDAYGYWVGDDVGGLYCYADDTFINMDNIIYCVENNVSNAAYNEWSEYCLWAKDFDQNVPNLKSWCKGCPRVDEETQKKLSAMKSDLIKACLDEKEKVKNNGKEKQY